jgi:hypothetical protein
VYVRLPPCRKASASERVIFSTTELHEVPDHVRTEEDQIGKMIESILSDIGKRWG